MTNFLSGKKKILTMILGVVSGLLIAFGLDWSEVSVVAGAVVSVGSAVSYLLVEGKIDVERIKHAADAVNDVIEYMGDDDADEIVYEDDPAVLEETGQGGDV
ncbi:MAG: hypothetical protein IJV91_13705 [Kiritimatiellae bacterium]|nr:hypothetical protein [Kiritimatiellia bacterium]